MSGIIIAETKRALYFGCRGANEPGHYLQEGRKTIWDVPPECHWSLGLMDSGLLKNGRHRDVYDGKVWWTCGGRADLWYAFMWWDNSGDKRPGSNSGFYVRGFAPEVLTPESAKANATLAFRYACESYPWVVNRQRKPLVLQA
jgi:hypothetical protein